MAHSGCSAKFFHAFLAVNSLHQPPPEGLGALACPLEMWNSHAFSLFLCNWILYLVHKIPWIAFFLYEVQVAFAHQNKGGRALSLASGSRVLGGDGA